MPPRELSKHVVVYTLDGNTFGSIGVLNDGKLMTRLSEIVDTDSVDNDRLRELVDIHVELKISFFTRLKLMWILKRNHREHGYFKRVTGAFKTFFEGLKYQIKHRKK